MVSLSIQETWLSLSKYYLPPQVPQKCQFETFEHEYYKQGSHGCIHADPVLSLFFEPLNLKRAVLYSLVTTPTAPKQHVWQIGSTTGGLVSAAPAFILAASFLRKVTKKDFQEKLVSTAAVGKKHFSPPGKNPQLFNRLRRKGNEIKTFFSAEKLFGWMNRSGIEGHDNFQPKVVRSKES